jgi:hypothetical protein
VSPSSRLILAVHRCLSAPEAGGHLEWALFQD